MATARSRREAGTTTRRIIATLIGLNLLLLAASD
jgi:hypothetical protein